MLGKFKKWDIFLPYSAGVKLVNCYYKTCLHEFNLYADSGTYLNLYVNTFLNIMHSLSTFPLGIFAQHSKG